LVDELWNDARIFLREGTLEFADNQARKFKEDCHRLAGAAKSAVVYYVPDGIHAARVFLFTPSDEPIIRILFSKDGRTFEAAESAAARFTTYGEDAYGFLKALRYSARPGAAGCRHVKIEFLTEAQLSRVEIDHARVD